MERILVSQAQYAPRLGVLVLVRQAKDMPELVQHHAANQRFIIEAGKSAGVRPPWAQVDGGGSVVDASRKASKIAGGHWYPVSNASARIHSLRR
jgi:hypothetical protein